MVPEFNIGEAPLDNAPLIRLSDGNMCVPQHYLKYAHTRESVELILADIAYDDHYIPFACEDKGGIYIQIGIIGFDNYKPARVQSGRKIVFGRCWRVEPNLPTSEIIQTVFLALKKAREHEIRELFVVSHNGKTTTPFNNHHDLPLMARHRTLLRAQPCIQSAQDTLSNITFDRGQFTITCAEQRKNGFWLIDLDYRASVKSELHTDFEDPISLMVKDLNANTLYHALLAEVLRQSDRHIDENFTYKGFARFSHDVDVTAISELSALTRKLPEASKAHFAANFESANYETDATRAPQLYRSAYGQSVKAALKRLNVVDGVMPIEVSA